MIAETFFFFFFFETTGDFFMEIVGSLRFYVDYMQGKPFTHSSGSNSPREGRKKNFGEAFGVAATTTSMGSSTSTSKQPMPVQPMTSTAAAEAVSPEEAVLLRPYPFAGTEEHGHV